MIANTADPIYAIIELMGHQRMAGTVSDHTLGGGSFVRIDVPPTSKQPGFTRIVNPSAIYAINPVTEEMMKVMAESFQSKPIEAYDVRLVYEKVKEISNPNNTPALQDADVDKEEQDYTGKYTGTGAGKQEPYFTDDDLDEPF